MKWLSHVSFQTLNFCILGVVLLLRWNASILLTQWGVDNTVYIYLQEDIRPEEREKIEQEVRKWSPLSIELVSSDEAKKEFEKMSPNLVGDLKYTLPESLRVKLPSDFKDNKLLREIQDVSGVSGVDYGKEWLEHFQAIQVLVDRSLIVLVFIILVGNFFSLRYQIQNFVISHSEEIAVCELLGFTPWQIRRDIFLKSLFLAAFSLFGAIACVFVIYVYANKWLSQQDFLIRVVPYLEFFNWGVAGLALGCLLIFVGSMTWYSLQKMNTGWLAAQGKY